MREAGRPPPGYEEAKKYMASRQNGHTIVFYLKVGDLNFFYRSPLATLCDYLLCVFSLFPPITLCPCCSHTCVSHGLLCASYPVGLTYRIVLDHGSQIHRVSCGLV